MLYKNYLYFDCNATLPMSDNVQTATSNYLGCFNASALYANKERSILKSLMDDLSFELKTSPNNIIITSGGSESNSTIINHCFLTKRGNVVYDPCAHPSVISKIKELSMFGYEPRPFRVSGGIPIIQSIFNSIDNNTSLVVLNDVNSELGTKIDVLNIASHIKRIKPDLWIHIDAVQSFLRSKIDYLSVVDSVSLSFHKIGASKGCGALYTLKNITPLVSGHQNNGLRGGTYNISGIASAFFAMKEMKQIKKEKGEHLKDLFWYLFTSFQRIFKDTFFIYTDFTMALGNCMLVSFNNNCAYEIQKQLAKKNIIVGTGSACNSDIKSIGPVVGSFNILDCFKSPIRLSWTYKTTKDDMTNLVKNIKELLIKE